MSNAVGFVEFERRGELHLCMAFLQWSFNVVKFPEDLNRGGTMVRVMLTSTHRRWMIVLVLILVSATAQMVSADSVADHVVISEVQTYNNSDTDDWIELYNPTNNDINLSFETYRIEKTKTAADPDLVMRVGDTDDGTYPGGTIIPAHGFYLIVRDDASNTLKDKADAIGTKGSFTWTGSGHTLYLGDAAISSDSDPDIVDKVGFGSGATYSETSPAPAIPDGKSIRRRVNATIDYQYPYGPAWDSDDNSADFFIQDSPNPMNSTTSSADPMPPVPELSTLALFSVGLLILAGCAYMGRRAE